MVAVPYLQRVRLAHDSSAVMADFFRFRGSKTALRGLPNPRFWPGSDACPELSKGSRPSKIGSAEFQGVGLRRVAPRGVSSRPLRGRELFCFRKKEEDYGRNRPLDVEGELKEPFISNVKRET